MAVSASEPWVNISPANGFGATECTVSIDSTLINGMRKAEIRFIPQGQAAMCDDGASNWLWQDDLYRKA